MKTIYTMPVTGPDSFRGIGKNIRQLQVAQGPNNKGIIRDLESEFIMGPRGEIRGVSAIFNSDKTIPLYNGNTNEHLPLYNGRGDRISWD
jgi:hypothetical protein